MSCQFLFNEGLVKHIACQPLLIYCLCLSIRPLCVDGLERISVRDFRLYGFPSESELPASPSLRNGSRHPHFWGWHFGVSGSVPLELLFLKGCPGARETPTLRTARLSRRKLGLFGTKIRKSENSHGHPFESRVHSTHKGLIDSQKQRITQEWHAMCLKRSLIQQH